MQIEKNLNSPARKRLELLFDDGSYTEINSFTKEKDSLAGVISAYGYVNGNPVYAFSQDKSVNGGAVGKAHAEKIAKLYSLAAKTGTPVVGIHDSNGAFVDGSADSLIAYSEMISASSLISGVVPQVSVIMGTCAGSAAILACSSDFVIMTKDSEFFVAPPFDTKKNGVGTAAACAKAGVAHAVCENDEEALAKTKEILNLMPSNNLSSAPMFEFDENNTALSSGELSAIVDSVADSGTAVELSAEFGTASYTALAAIAGSSVGIVATNKADSRLTADDCDKLARFIRMCDAFSLPVITIVDTEGFEADSEAELAGSVRDMTKLANCYAEATTVKISLITGKAVGPAYVALAGKNLNTDFTFAWENAVISPLAPVTAVEFLWHDKLKGAENLAEKRNELAKEFSETTASAASAAERNAVDEVIAMADTRNVLVSALDILSGKRVAKLPKKHSNIPF
ncbi:MAG: carboxyl transferase domain-containing protein [Oscillospiraceae bacterium]